MPLSLSLSLSLIISHSIPDLLEVADLAGARRFEVLIDERHHAAQSLLNPGLAACQGPAVSVFFDVELRRVRGRERSEMGQLRFSRSIRFADRNHHYFLSPQNTSKLDLRVSVS
jgi:hypothetical protein